jgi:hypothetical protein
MDSAHAPLSPTREGHPDAQSPQTWRHNFLSMHHLLSVPSLHASAAAGPCNESPASFSCSENNIHLSRAWLRSHTRRGGKSDALLYERAVVEERHTGSDANVAAGLHTLPAPAAAHRTLHPRHRRTRSGQTLRGFFPCVCLFTPVPFPDTGSVESSRSFGMYM